MARYSVNCEIVGIDNVDILDGRLTEGSNNTIVMVLNKDTDNKLDVYYNRVIDILVSKNKLILIIVGEESSISKPICNLMCVYRNYNIYNVLNLDVIDSEYIVELESREPSYEEVGTFIGGDTVAYSDINTVLLGIDSLVKQGDSDGLKVFLEKHLTSISGFTEAIDYMKKIVDSVNSDEVKHKIEEMKGLVEGLKEQLEESKQVSKEASLESDKLKKQIDEYKSELTVYKQTTEEFQKQAVSNMPIYREYSERNTSLMKCRTKTIIYFKEISQIAHINSLVVALMEALNAHKIKNKLVIYDDKSSMLRLYMPLTYVDSTAYMAKRDIYAGKMEKLVVVEPNPVILEDILTYSNGPNEVVIIYDRMRQANDIVSGNNVHKFYVMNSSKEFKEVQSILKITDLTRVITRENSSIGPGTLYIPNIADYNSGTDTGKLSKYLKLCIKNNKKPLIRVILDKAKIAGIN